MWRYECFNHRLAIKFIFHHLHLLCRCGCSEPLRDNKLTLSRHTYLNPSSASRTLPFQQTHHSLSPPSPWQQRGHAGAYGSSFSLCLWRLGSPGGIYTSLIYPPLFSFNSGSYYPSNHPFLFIYMHPSGHCMYCTHTACVWSWHKSNPDAKNHTFFTEKEENNREATTLPLTPPLPGLAPIKWHLSLVASVFFLNQRMNVHFRKQS